MNKEQDLKEELIELETKEKVIESIYYDLEKQISETKLEIYKLKHKDLIGKYFKDDGGDYVHYYKIKDIVNVDDEVIVEAEWFELGISNILHGDGEFELNIVQGTEITKNEYYNRRKKSLTWR